MDAELALKPAPDFRPENVHQHPPRATGKEQGARLCYSQGHAFIPSPRWARVYEMEDDPNLRGGR